MGKTAFGSLGAKRKIEIDVPESGAMVIAPVAEGESNVDLVLKGLGSTGAVRVGHAIHFVIAAGPAVADFDGALWISDGAYELIEARERHAVAGAAANIQVFKVPSGTAKSAGTNMLASAGFSAAAVANTVVLIAQTATVANRQIVAGDAIGIELSAASAALDGVSVTVYIKPI